MYKRSLSEKFSKLSQEARATINVKNMTMSLS